MDGWIALGTQGFAAVAYDEVRSHRTKPHMIDEQATPSIDARLRAALEATSDNVVLLDRDLRIVFVNRKTEELNGVEPHRYDGLLIWEAWPSSDVEPVRRAIAEAQETGRTVRLVHNHAAEGGLDRWLEIDLSPIPEGLAMFFRDVTQRWLEEDLLRAAADTVPGLVSYLDRDFVYRFCNRRYEEVFGLGLDQIVGRPVREIVGDEAFERALPHFERALAGKEVRFENWMPYQGIGRRFMRVTYTPRKGPNGGVEGIFAQIVDDTENRRTEEARREQEERLRQTQESLSLAMKAGRMGWWSRDLTSGEVRWSPELEEIFGLDPESFRGDEDRFFEFVHPEDHALVAKAVGEALANRTDYAVDFRFLRTDGSEGWMEGRGRAIYGPDGPTALFGIGIDITARREFEERLRESEARLDLALAAASLGTWDLNLDTGETRYGGGAAALFGRPPGEFSLAYDEWTAMIHPQDLRRLNAAFAAMVDRAEPYRMEFRSPQPDGSVRWVEVSGVPIRDGDGKPIRALGVFSDVTARRAYEEELERRVKERTAQLEAARRSQESWNYSVSHDLRAPLRAVMSTSRILQMDYGEELSQEARELLDRQAAAAKKLGNLIDELLQASRLASQDLKLEPLDLSAIAREAAEEQMGNSGKSFALRVAEGMRATGDPRLVKLIFSNFLENAMKYSPSGTSIDVGERAGAFFVHDEGIGFEMQYEPKVWRPFERLVLDSEYAGTGIGLYNVAQMVERMGGRAWAESVPGQGSTFYFTLGEREGL